MSYKDENYNKVAKLPINHFLTANNKLWGKNYSGLRAKQI